MRKGAIWLLLMWVLSICPAMSQVGKICKWDNDKKAAVVLTFDDWSPGQFPVATPALQQRGLNGTFYIVTRNIFSWADIKTEIANGNEIGNHTYSHPILTQLNSQPSNPTSYLNLSAQLKAEIGDAKSYLESNLSNYKVTTFAYPFGDFSNQVIDSIKAHGHICARGVQPPSGIYYTYNFATQNSDYYNLYTYPMSSSVNISAFSGEIKKVIAGGGLLSYLYHSLDDGANYNDNWFSPVQKSALEEQLDTLSNYKNKAWITTMAKAVKYHREAKCATLSEIQASNGTNWIVSLTDTLSNNTLYNQPLSLKLKMNGIKYTSVKQNGLTLKIDSTYNDTIMFHAVPDAGNITLATSGPPPHLISVKDSTFSNGIHTIPVYLITWTDNAGKPRTALMAKSFVGDNYPGICVRFTYYDDSNNLITINSPTPSDPELANRGFGATIHHIEGGTWVAQGTNPTLTMRSQGAHYTIFDLVQTVDGAKETVTYSFFDGLDYFQWQETVQCGTGVNIMDSRAPYCTMDWDGNGAFDVIDGQEYGAQKYLSQPSYTANKGAYTFGGTCDIPYVQQWKGNHEVGYVQTQTYTQQLAGSPDFSSAHLPAIGNVDTLNKYSWALDFQMNIFDKLQKITWGMPYGYMEGTPAAGLTSTGTKNGWGQYSLSVIFDALSSGGVKRIMNENRIIQNGNVTLTAGMGSVVTTGPVGTANPATQTLSPVGFDHNYRAWWLQANSSDQAQVTMNVATSSLKNPLFRVKNMTQLPSVVSYNGILLVANLDYYGSYDAGNKEAWVTLLKTVTGSNTILIQGNNTGITINSVTLTPSSVSNHTATNLTFAVAATVDGTIKSVTLDLSSIGGSATTAMTKGPSDYGLVYSLPAGTSAGAKTITVTVTDNIGNIQTATIALTITTGIAVSSATVTPSAIVNSVSNPLTFTVSASDDGSVAGVTLDLSFIGGGTSVAMTNGGANYTLNYTAPSGIAEGTTTIVATVTDDQGNTLKRNITLTVAGPVSRTSLYTDAATMITGTWASLTLAEQTTTSAQEGQKDYLFTFNSAVDSYFAGFGLNLSTWSVPGKIDLTNYDTLQIAYNGPVSTNGTGIQIQFTDGTPNPAVCATCTMLSGGPTLPAVSNYTVVKIPISTFNASNTINMTKVAELDISITGFGRAATSGTLRIDNILLIKKLVVTDISSSELESNTNVLSVYPNPNNGSFTLQSTVEGSYSIVNDLGQTIKQVTLDGTNNFTSKLENLNTGMYVVVGSTNKGKAHAKLIVTK